MTKEKFIRFRVSESFHNAITENAVANKMSVSGYSRKVIKRSVKKIKDPFKSDDFLHLAQWTFTVKDSDPEAHIFDVKHYLKIIKKYYPLLDANLQKLFDKVIKDLKEIKMDHKKYKNTEFDDGEFFYRFGKENNELSFNYEEFHDYF